MPQSIPPGLKKEHVLQALSDLDGGIDHPFGAAHRLRTRPRRQALRPEGRRRAGLPLLTWAGSCGPKSSAAARLPGQANFVLRKLGFTVVRKGEEAAEEEKPAHKDWSEQEVGLIVADYFTMLEKELLGKPFKQDRTPQAWPRNSPGGRTGPSSSSTPTSQRS